MKVRFYKYQGTGNDFIMLEDQTNSIRPTKEQILKICHRRFGIGADGLIILRPKANCDFEMDYYNSDGTQSFCGNGSRCAQAFAKQLKWIDAHSTFLAIDGEHRGKFDGAWYATEMQMISQIERIGNDYLIDTGSPHYIRFVEKLAAINVVEEGRAVRFNDTFKHEGVNVNFVELKPEGIAVRTYERGVEDETYSCGTGVTAAAIAYLVEHQLQLPSVAVETKGGDLRIELERAGHENFKNIWLCGPADYVFEGEYVF